MQVETQIPTTYPTVASSPLLNREARDAANRWLARFAPVIDDTTSLGVDETRQRLELIEQLRPDGQAALQSLHTQATHDDAATVQTVRSALNELDALETDLRRRLAALSPGDPEGQVDLGVLQAKLAEKAAEREVGSWGTHDALVPPTLDLKTSPPNWAAAGMLGLFSLGWNAFTTFHAFFLIGGFYRAVGPAALFLILFYSMFWAVGIGMALGAFMSACQEEISLDGRRFSLRRKLLGFTWKQNYTAGEGTRARLTVAAVRSRNQAYSGGSGMQVAVTDVSGKEIKFASGRPQDEQERLIAKINQYLAAQSG